MEKDCSRCKRTLPITCFGKHKQQVSGLRPECRNCRSKLDKQRRQKWMQERAGLPEPSSKFCYKCKKNLPISEFCKDIHRKDGFHVYCMTCRHGIDRINRIKWRANNKEKFHRINRKKDLSKHGLTFEGYEKIFQAQNGVCAICSQFRVAGRKKYLDVDHCHTTNKVRGLLCGYCNIGIGKFSDDPHLLRKAAAYLVENS